MAVLAVAFSRLDPRWIPPYSDYWDYLQLGRQLRHGDGFTSLFTYPLFLGYSGSGPFFPLFWRPPLFPALVGFGMIFTGTGSLAAPLALQAAGYLLAVLGAYLLALEFVRPRWALFSGIVVALSPDVLGLAEPGIATAAFTAALVFGFLLAVRARTRRQAALTGLYFGALTLLRGEAILLLPAVVWLLWAGDRGERERRIWVFLGAAIVVMLPWTIRCWVVAGRAFSAASSLLYINTTIYPGWESSRHLELLDRSALLWALRHPAALHVKALKNLYHFLTQALLLPLPALAPFAWAAAARITRVGKESAYCAAVLIALGLSVLFLSPLEYAARFLHPFIPLATVVAVILLARIREELPGPGGAAAIRRPAAWIAAAVIVLSALLFIGAAVNARREQAAARASFEALGGAPWPQLAASIPAGAWSIGDYAAYYAWWTGRPFVGVPRLPDLDRVRRPGGPRGVILLYDRRGPADPIGLPAAAALADSLAAMGWRRSDAGPCILLTAP